MRKDAATSDGPPTWAPPSCTLPTAERPFRSAEFDAIFAKTASVERSAPTTARLIMAGDRSAAAAIRDLAARESECCSFFNFAVTDRAGVITLDISVPDGHVEVLTALVERAAALSEARA